MPNEIDNSARERLESLKRTILLRKEGFFLLIASFNNDTYRDKLIVEIDRIFTDSTILSITKDRFPGFAGFENHIASLSKGFSLVHVVNKGEKFYKDTWPVFYKGLNYHREKIAAENPVSIILWMRPEDIKDFALTAPDMWAWRSGVFDFELPEQQFETLETNDTEDKKYARIEEITNYLKDNPGLEDNVKAALHQELGELYYSLDNYQKAQEYLVKTLDFYVKKGDSREKQSIYKLLESIARASVRGSRIPGEYVKRAGIPQKILVVDDDPGWNLLLSRRFKKQIGNKEWEFIFAQNGREAFEKLNEIPGIEIIFLDIQLPDKEGFSFLDKLNKIYSPTIKCIAVASSGDLENIRKAMNLGAIDFITKPLNPTDIEIIIDKTFRQIEMIKNASYYREVFDSVQRELHISAKIQQSMLPDTFPPFPGRKEFDIYARMIPSEPVGGDFYDFFLVAEDRLAFSVGDVAGSGIPAALQMATASAFLRTNAFKWINPGECLRTLNNDLVRVTKDINSFITLFYGLFDIKTGVVHYSSCGHPSPYIIRKNGNVEKMPEVGGIPLGLFENTNYEVEEFQLEKGDIIFVFTDGLIDIENPERARFGEGEKRLTGYLEGKNKLALKEIIEGVMAEIKAFASGRSQEDDIVMLALRFN